MWRGFRTAPRFSLAGRRTRVGGTRLVEKMIVSPNDLKVRLRANGIELLVLELRHEPDIVESAQHALEIFEHQEQMVRIGRAGIEFPRLVPLPRRETVEADHHVTLAEDIGLRAVGLLVDERVALQELV